VLRGVGRMSFGHLSDIEREADREPADSTRFKAGVPREIISIRSSKS
jgi:hypothetical protein